MLPKTLAKTYRYLRSDKKEIVCQALQWNGKRIKGLQFKKDEALSMIYSRPGGYLIPINPGDWICEYADYSTDLCVFPEKLFPKIFEEASPP